MHPFIFLQCFVSSFYSKCPINFLTACRHLLSDLSLGILFQLFPNASRIYPFALLFSTLFPYIFSQFGLMLYLVLVFLSYNIYLGEVRFAFQILIVIVHFFDLFIMTGRAHRLRAHCLKYSRRDLTLWCLILRK